LSHYAITFETLNLSPGDEIAVFDGDICVGVSTVTSITDNELNIITSKADGDDPGFTQGNNIIFRVWDASEQIEITNIDGEFYGLDGQASDDDTFIPNADVAVDLYFSTITQNIQLKSGWNIISFYVTPEVADMEELFKTLIDDDALYKIIDEAGQRFIFNAFAQKWINEIGDMSSEEGYQVKVKKDVVLTVEGEKVKLPYEINLAKGWNIFGWPDENSQTAMNIVQTLIDDNTLIKVIDEQGRRIIYNAFAKQWIDEIGEFEPGKGFLIKVTEDTILNIDEEKISRRSRRSNKGSGRSFGNMPITGKHCKPVWDGNPYNSMNLWIVEIEGFEIDIDDEICVLDGNRCVGSSIVMQKLSHENALKIVSSQNDGFGKGFTSGNEIMFKIWDTSEDKEITAIKAVLMDLNSGKVIETGFIGNADFGVKLVVVSGDPVYAAQ